MTANKDLKRAIRRRMLKTGESYTAARRHFLNTEDSPMTEQVTHAAGAVVDLPIDHLELTLKTTRQLRKHGIERVGQLVERFRAGPAELGLERERAVEIREVLASRGL